MNRQHLGLRSPNDVDLTQIPTADHSERPLFRAVHIRYGHPWWFSNRTAAGPSAGRFDLDGHRGTCYLASTAVAAILEHVADPESADPPLFSTATLERMHIWHGSVPQTDVLADVTVASVPQLTGEIATVCDYALPWEWAEAFDAIGRSGILYRSRFAQDDCVALFGEAGVQREPPASMSGTPATDFEQDLPVDWTVSPTPTEDQTASPPDP